MSRLFVAFLVAVLLTAPVLAPAISVIEYDSDVGFRVEEVGTGSAITSCNPIKMESSPYFSGPYYLVGYYGHGDWTPVQSSIWYRFTPHPCSGYTFHHWKIQYSEDRGLDGLRSIESMIGGSASLRSLNGGSISGDRLYVYMSEGSSVRVTLYLEESGYQLRVKVDPVGSGSVSPYGRGVHVLARGTVVKLKPNAHAGWEFSHWTIDGRTKDVQRLSVQMNRDHEVVAHFRKEMKTPTREIPAPIPVKTCPLPDGWPYTAKYRGYSADLEFNSDLLGNFSGKAKFTDRNNVIVLGWLAVKPQPWEKHGVSLREGTISVNNVPLYSNDFRDFGIIHLTCKDGFRARVAGTTEQGTRAALVWVLENYRDMVGKTLVVIEWKDVNSDGFIQPGELSEIYTVPL